MTLEAFLIAGEPVTTSETFKAVDPSLGHTIDPPFAVSDESHVERACIAAAAAFEAFAEAPIETRARLLETIADEIEGIGDALIVRAMAETGLPRPRLEGERGRTTGQLRMFAAVVREGGWQDIRIDSALPDRQPLPRPDLRMIKRPLGPVAVFGASNFPLAFSVAGGDTASALAAGCPVVIKGHPAHPGLSAMVGGAIAKAVAAVGLPAGVFSLLAGPSNALGSALVLDPRIAAVGFTGSRQGGLALVELAARRPVPIPVYAEMSSVNPVILFPAALAARAEALAAGYVGSLTFSAGQLCTNPGLVFAVDGPGLARFSESAANALAAAGPATMLTPGIAKAFRTGVAKLTGSSGVTELARGAAPAGECQSQASLFTISAPDFIAQAEVREEVFGHTSLVVRCADQAELCAALAVLEGQLTVTLQIDPDDGPAARALMPLLVQKAGRLLANGWPTGVEVAPAMVHGGPFPATSDGRSTSVGWLAIDRFLRPVCYQNMPAALLPPALAGDGAGSWRLVDGHRVAA
ncbi:aldehyde dehydrogenase (NADP(+)) [Glacieibacterium frigidum]|uniref:Aldehyde dehydrogenase (NADP(+)) n=1 Tax=Glacieibacterium frigidum TaxID=2593303 RepID=A0A552UGJ5_9SPHN|nr:aldehyde dehydrogenase (NADP(+)) [Glacieibacterium frigidum]TRW17330.1 aldehyde dehydrogenase (NADP(+)) [Glacieibacterium frigidum]